MNNFSTTPVYHGGSAGKMKGWPSGGGGSTSPNPDTIRMVLEEKSFHQANSNPAIAALHTTPNDSTYGYKTYDLNQLTRIFATFALPHKQWSRVLTGATGVRLWLFGYHETTIAAPNNTISINVSLTGIDQGGSYNYTAPAAGYVYNRTIDAATSAPYQNMTIFVDDMDVNDPGGGGLIYDPIFHLRILRNNSGGGDTYPNVFRLQGGIVEFPLV